MLGATLTELKIKQMSEDPHSMRLENFEHFIKDLILIHWYRHYFIVQYETYFIVQYAVSITHHAIKLPWRAIDQIQHILIKIKFFSLLNCIHTVL